MFDCKAIKNILFLMALDLFCTRLSNYSAPDFGTNATYLHACTSDYGLPPSCRTRLMISGSGGSLPKPHLGTSRAS